jgi:hypothetical protein
MKPIGFEYRDLPNIGNPDITATKITQGTMP